MLRFDDFELYLSRLFRFNREIFVTNEYQRGDAVES